MRFVHGPVPEDPAFQPIEEGWKPIREPDPVLMQVLAVPVMILTGWILFNVIKFATVMSWREVMGSILLSFLIMIPFHELVHALASPSFGMTRQTAIGIWPSKLLFYAHHEGALSRRRFLIVLAAPIMLLTLLPLLLCVIFRWDLPGIAALAFANGLGAAGDLLGLILVTAQIPGGSTVRNKGWRSYWKPPIVESP